LSPATLETEEKNLEGEEKVKFLSFIRRMLQWRPEDRASASELLQDPWLALEDEDQDDSDSNS
jgi:serine/threonine protein kinase